MQASDNIGNTNKNVSQSRYPGHERLILDCMIGDSTLYARADAVKASWKFVDPILNAWKNDPDIPLYFYECNTWGPKESDALFNEKFMKWREPFAKFKTE